MKASETLHTLSRMLGALRNNCQVSEVVFQCGPDWKCCYRVEGDGDVTRLYAYPSEPESIYPLTVTMYVLGRSYTVTIDSAKELANA
jgi:hypothetical protein